MKTPETTDHASRPRILWASSLALVALGFAALALGGLKQPAFGAYCVVVAAGPIRATAASVERAVLLAYGLGAWALFGLAPVFTIGEPLGGPYGGHPVLFVAGLAGAVSRIWALSSATTHRWSRPGSR